MGTEQWLDILSAPFTWHVVGGTGLGPGFRLSERGALDQLTTWTVMLAGGLFCSSQNRQGQLWKVGASGLGIPEWTSGCCEDSSALSSRPSTPQEGGRNPLDSPLHFWGRGLGFRWFYSGTSSVLHIIRAEASQEPSARLLNGSCILEENGPLLSIPCPSARAPASPGLPGDLLTPRGQGALSSALGSLPVCA